MNETPYALFRFLIEILLASMLYVRYLKKKDHFGRRLLVSLTLCFAVSACWNRELSEHLILTIVRYIILFNMVTFLIYNCFNVSIQNAMFYSIAGYATQHFVSVIVYYVSSLMSASVSIAFEYLVYTAITVGGYGLFYFIFSKKIYIKYNHDISTNELLLMAIMTIFSMIVFTTFKKFFGAIQSQEFDIIIRCYSLVSSFMILFIQVSISQKSHWRNESIHMENLLRLESKQLKASQEMIHFANIKYHDIKYLLNHFESRLSKSEMDELRSKISVYDMSVKTDNPILDIVLAEKSPICANKHIKMTCMADGKRLSFLESGEIYSLFGNALDNAIEAVSQLEDIEKRVISLIITYKKGFVHIHLENYYAGQLIEKEGTLVTMKEDSDYHGYGLKSMKMIVEKYHGMMTYKTDNQQFNLNIIFPLSDLKMNKM